MFESVKSNRISEYIISQIRDAVFEGKLKPGDRLPPEHQLMETFGVSKATLREALRGLELLGFLQEVFGGGAELQNRGYQRRADRGIRLRRIHRLQNALE